MWKSFYHDDGYGPTRNICAQDSKKHPVFEIDFDGDGKRYYCYIDAGDIEEALGIFFMNHDDLTYHNVLACHKA